MLSVLLIWIYIFILLIVFGLITFHMYKRITKQTHPEISLREPKEILPPVGLLLLTGYCSITAVLQVFSVFSNIALKANLFLLCCGLIFCLLSKKFLMTYLESAFISFRKTPAYVLLLSLMYVFIVLFMSIKSDHLDNDTGFYHAQVIQWAEKFPCVKGIANLFPNYAFNNSSLLMSALFSFTFIHQYPFQVLNSFLVLAFMISITVLIFRSTKNNFGYNFLYATIGALSFFFLRGKMSLPYPDVTVTIILLSAFILLLRNSETDLFPDFQFQHFAFIICVATAISIKLTAGMMFIFVVLLILKYRKSLSKQLWILIISSCFFFAIPWIYRSYLQSGYLIFPYYQIDFFSAEWKLPAHHASVAYSWIAGYARTMQISDAFNLSISDWFPIWWNNKDMLEKFFLGWISISPLAMIYIYILSKKKTAAVKDQISFLLSIWLISFVALIAWFCSAPDFRFGMSYIIICALIPFQSILFLSDGLLKNNAKITRFFSFVLLLYFLVWPLKLYINHEITFSQHWLLPEPKYKTIATTKVELNGLSVSVPVDNQRCWNAPLPCTCLPDSNLHLIGNDLEAGFKIYQK